MTTSTDLPALEGAPYYHFGMHSMSIRGSHSIIPSAPITVGDERQLLMDRHTVDSTWNLVRMLHQDMPGTLCNFSLATLRPDGFVSLGNMGFSPHPGYMLTRPIECPGGHLRINARTTSADGFVRVAVRTGSGDQDGTYLEGWNFEDMEVPFSGDSTDAALRWRGQSGFDRLQGQAVRLHFWMQDAEVYSWWFERTGGTSRDG